jgi:hypothetical protein
MGESGKSPMVIRSPGGHLRGGDMSIQGTPSVESFAAMPNSEEGDYGNNGVGGSFIALLARLCLLKLSR